MGSGTHAGPAAGAPYGAAILARGVPKLAGGARADLARWPSVELLVGPRFSWGVLKWAGRPAAGAFGGAPNGATILARGVPS
eukprot:9502227-Pyramimonas_sp.AAC.1